MTDGTGTRTPTESSSVHTALGCGVYHSSGKQIRAASPLNFHRCMWFLAVALNGFSPTVENTEQLYMYATAIWFLFLADAFSLIFCPFSRCLSRVPVLGFENSLHIFYMQVLYTRPKDFPPLWLVFELLSKVPDECVDFYLRMTGLSGISFTVCGSNLPLHFLLDVL